MEWASQPINEILNLDQQGKLPTLHLNKDDVEKNLEFIKEFAIEAGFLIIHSQSNDTYEAKLDIDGISPSESEEEHEERITELRKPLNNINRLI